MAAALTAGGAFIAGCSVKDALQKNGGDTMEIIEGDPKIDGKVDGRVYLLRTNDRRNNARELIEKFNLNELENERVAVKANFNSMDSFPGTTHPDMLRTILEAVKSKTDDIVIAERSGMGKTSDVLTKLGIADIAGEMGIEIINLERHKRWIRFNADHWLRGFLFADIFYDADHVIQTCCLKTHRFGGHFTMSLKNSVGMIAKRIRFYDYMAELHLSPNQRKMIAEINIAYTPFLIILDAIEGFSEGGPDKGRLIKPKLLIAGKDRVAVDAVGVALLRIYGTTPEVSRGSVFDQEQIKRAAELGIGVSSPEEIDLVPLNRDAEGVAGRIMKELLA